MLPKLYTFNHFAIIYIETGDDTFYQHWSASVSVNCSVSNAFPSITLSHCTAFSAVNSVKLATPPDACHCTIGNCCLRSAYNSTWLPVKVPSRLMSVQSTWRQPTSRNPCKQVSKLILEACCQPWVANKRSPLSLMF